MFIEKMKNVGDYQSGKKLLKQSYSQVSLFLDNASSKPLNVYEQTMESMKNDEHDPDNHHHRHEHPLFHDHHSLE